LFGLGRSKEHKTEKDTLHKFDILE
jgi:hypothetical protein